MREYISQLNCSEAGSLPYEVHFEGLGHKSWDRYGTQRFQGVWIIMFPSVLMGGGGGAN